MAARRGKREEKPTSALDEYNEKRDFARTPEPAARPGEERGGALRFVLHRHDASHLHWDLRLEAEGVLRSFAVPRGIAWDPKVKRLAVRTEDHPLEYENFAGVIPAGEYGAGRMRIEDRGTYVARPGYDLVEGLARGEIKVEIFGRRLRGEWHLVRTSGRAPSLRGDDGKEHWLLFKARDAFALSNPFARGCDFSRATRGELPKVLRLADAQDGAQLFEDDEWGFEAAFSGLRIALERDGDALRFRGSRLARTWTRRLHDELEALSAELRELPGRRLLLDGVLVRTCSGAIVHDTPAPKLEKTGADELVYCATDILYYEDWLLRDLPLLERKRIVTALVAGASCIQSVDPVLRDGFALADALRDAGYREMLAKPLQSKYRAGLASGWRRIDVTVPRSAKSARSPKAATAPSRRVRITNEDKVWFPQHGITKGDVLQYYDAVAAAILPQLRDRPLALQRFPDGIESEGFYQKNVPDHAPAWVDTHAIESEGSGRTIHYLVANTRESLRWAVQEGGFELHCWHSRLPTLDEADYSLIDLDPKQAPFADVVTIASFVGDLLREVGLRPVLKTSGQSGLHILVPLEPGYRYEHARAASPRRLHALSCSRCRRSRRLNATRDDARDASTSIFCRTGVGRRWCRPSACGRGRVHRSRLRSRGTSWMRA